MDNYLKKAVASIYSEEDDFIIIGLTGRTGSGCTTAARILSAPFDKIRHSLFSGETPDSSIQRKQKIILSRARHVWKSFIHIQASSVISLILKETKNEEIEKLFKSLEIDKEKINKVNSVKIRKPGKNSSLETTVNFYTKTLIEKHTQIKEILGKDFTKIYQEIGKRIRRSGAPTSETLAADGFTNISHTIDKIIKEIRQKSKKDQTNKKTYIVIDAIRNQFEATYFQDRYSSFYLLAISCPEEDRNSRLSRVGYSAPEIKKINEAEHTEKPIDFDNEDAYIKQDIASCLQRADLYINNPNSKDKASEFFDLANQLITFVTLMIHPGLVTPSAIERCMQVAYTAKLNSGCISRQVGAAITDDSFSIKAIGWNDVPEGQVPCSLRNRSDLLAGRDAQTYSTFERSDTEFREHIRNTTIPLQNIWKETGRNLSYCFKSEFNRLKSKDNQVHTRSLHAEENAFLQIVKHGGVSIKGGKLFTTASPCDLCSKKAYQLGIKEIYFIDPYPGIATTHTLMGGSKNPDLILFSGAIGRAFHNLYTPKLPYKDELATLSKYSTSLES
ncbi:hypothetical protein [Metapseudomonas otitidis]|uniref:hypothetical protein n=1 Tax=Metapseudomonas otitidis TaxID=319939 RepID=UPI003CF0590D